MAVLVGLDVGDERPTVVAVAVLRDGAGDEAGLTGVADPSVAQAVRLIKKRTMIMKRVAYGFSNIHTRRI